jgi:outer membrane protein assembly factor BamB
LVLDETVFVGATDGTFYALDARQGTVRWTSQAEDKITGAANWADGPAAGGRRILFGSHDSTLRCFEAGTGALAWECPAGSYINGTPAVWQGLAVFGACDGQLHQVSLADGKVVASVDVGSYVAGSPAVADGVAYCGQFQGELVAVNLATRSILWRYGGRDVAGPFFASPAVAGDTVLAASRDHKLHAVERRTGTARWTFSARGEIDASPVVCGDRAVFSSADGRVYIVKLADGSRVWSYEIGTPLSATPAVAANLIVVAADDGRVYAFGAK